MAPTAHAKYSASAAQRWLNCGVSVRHSIGLDTAGREAQEGTLAHELLEAAMASTLTKALRLPQFQVDEDSDAPQVTDEMVDAVGDAVDWLWDLIEKHPQATWETELQLDKLKSVHPLTGGTSDFVLVDPEARLIHVVDFKYGKGHVVDVVDNVQALTYAVGCLLRYHNYDIRTVRITIIQPRAPHKAGQIRTWETDVSDLYSHATLMREAIERAESANAKAAAGPWCAGGFCAVRGKCAEYRRYSLTQALAEFDDVEATGDVTVPALRDLSAEEMRAVLAAADTVLDWVKQVQAYCHDQAMAGKIPEGWKLAPKRGRRHFRIDEIEIAERALDVGMLRDEFAPRKFLTVAKMEAAMGKKKFAAVFDGCVEKISSGYNLVPVNDPRPERVRAKAEDEFEDLE